MLQELRKEWAAKSISNSSGDKAWIVQFSGGSDDTNYEVSICIVYSNSVLPFNYINTLSTTQYNFRFKCSTLSFVFTQLRWLFIVLCVL